MQNNKPLLEVWGGIDGDRTFLRPIALHNVANMSTSGFTCMYHANIASEMGPNGWLITDVVLVNPSNNQITLPQKSVAIVAVNQIMKDPGNAPMSQGGMTVEERGGGVGIGNMNNIGNMGSNKTL